MSKSPLLPRDDKTVRWKRGRAANSGGDCVIEERVMMETHVPVDGLRSEHERYSRPPPPVPIAGEHRQYNPPPRPPGRPIHTRTFVSPHRDPPRAPGDQVIPPPGDHVLYRDRRFNPHPPYETHAHVPAPAYRGEPFGQRVVGGLNTPVPQQKDLHALAMRKHRARNEYTDTPSRLVVVQNNNNHNKALQNSSRTSGLDTRLSPEPIISQPGGSGLKKEPAEPVDYSTPCQESIICAQCGKCRCGVCMQQRPLPSKWICHGKYECSAQKCVEYCTCVWLVKALFYHCFKDCEADEEFKLDEPCACCDQPHCCKRWTCMGLMSLCLPCLCLYPPSQCCLALCTSCYNHGRGCRCRKDRVPGSKGLLLDSESSSA